ncbi:MAG: hypothetical protein PVJ02_16060 [Gemmatimonadota bacterium]
MFFQVVSLLGALLILLAFGLNQTGRIRPGHVSYALMNLLGSLLLLWIAVVDRRAGFILLEGAWAVLSIVPLVKRPTESE